MLDFKIDRLKNGLKTIYVPMKQSNTVAVLLLVATGSRFETEKENGISHFLEHMFFKGTSNRPNTMAIAQELDAIGANYNAFTSEEYTGYYVKCAKTKVGKAIDIISDMILNSKFEEKEIKKEKGVIIEEINMYEDLPQRQISDITKEHFYEGTALGRTVLGPKKNIKSFTRKDFVNYIKNHYSSKNSAVAIAGGGNINEWKKLVEEKFSSLNSEKPKEYFKIRKIKKGSSVRVKYKNTDQAHLTLGVETFKRTDSQRYSLKVLKNVLGGTMSSRLFSEVREKRGLAYYVGSDVWSFNDTGALINFAGVDKKRLDEAIKVITEQLQLIGKNGISREELKRAKDNIEGNIYLGLEDTFSVAEFGAESELLYGKIESPTEIVRKIKNLELEKINRLAKRIIKDNNLKLTIIGPYKNTDKFYKLI